jgi:NAD(P)-dependent dehydrogenase (short-subunit alcohol dehydrogenase family)
VTASILRGERHVMKLILIGATGTIGGAVTAALSQRHEIVAVSRHTEPLRVDISSPAAIRALFEAVGPIDGVISACGAARFKPLALLDDEDLAFCLQNKLMGQVNLVREGLQRVRDGGVIVVTSGILSRSPTPGSAAISLVNAGVEAFVRAAALEAPRGIRVNVVSPPWVSETLTKLGMDPKGGLPASVVAQAYVRAVDGAVTGQVIEPSAASGN